jgi:hypothetical protein
MKRWISIIIIVVMVFTSFSTIGTDDFGEGSDYWIEYGTREGNKYNWEIDFTSFSRPDEKTEFDSQAFDNISNEINVARDTGFTSGEINGNYSLWINNTPGSSGNARLRDYSATQIRTCAVKMKVFYNSTETYAGTINMMMYKDGNNFVQIYFQPSTNYINMRFQSKVSATEENIYRYLPMVEDDVDNHTMMFMYSWNNATGEIVARVNNYVISVDTQAILSGNIAYFNINLPTAGYCGAHFDDLYRWNTVFDIEEIRSTVPDSLFLAYPPNNKDFGYNTQIHADLMTANMSKPVYDLLNKYGVSGTLSYFIGPNSVPAKQDTIQYEYPGFNFSQYLSNQSALGHTIATHSLIDTSQTCATMTPYFEMWNDLIGEYPPIWIDHGGLSQNIMKYGADVSSIYYVDDLLDSYGTYKWANLRGGTLIGWPTWTGGDDSFYDYMVSSFSGGGVYSHSGIDNLYTESGGSYTTEVWLQGNPSPDAYKVAAYLSRGLVMDHNYISRYVYLDANNKNYSWYWTTHFPELTLTSYTTDGNLNANYHYYDATGTWKVYPRLEWTLYNFTNVLDVYSVNAVEMLDRAKIYSNIVTRYSNGNITIQNNDTQPFENATIYTTSTGFYGKALKVGNAYHLFMNGTNNWSCGATIDSIPVGTTTYQVVDAPYSIGENNTALVGRHTYNQTSDLFEINVNRNGTVHIDIPSGWNGDRILVRDVTTDTIIAWESGSVQFDGIRDHQYQIYEEYPADPAEDIYDQISALVPFIIATTSVILVVGVLSNGLVRPFNRLFRRT